MLNFRKFLDETLKGINDVPEFEENINQIKSDASSFLKEAKSDIETWVKQLENGEMAQEEFESLIKGIPYSAKFRGLTDLGLSEVQMGKIKRKLAAIIIRVILKLLL